MLVLLTNFADVYLQEFKQYIHEYKKFKWGGIHRRDYVKEWAIIKEEWVKANMKGFENPPSYPYATPGGHTYQTNSLIVQ